MTKKPYSHDPAPDPELARALREVEGEPPVEAVEWDALHARILDRAALPLARRRARQRWRWLRPAIPAAVAAGIAAIWLLDEQPATPPIAAAPSRGVVEDMLRADIPEQEFLRLAAGYEEEELLWELAGGDE